MPSPQHSIDLQRKSEQLMANALATAGFLRQNQSTPYRRPIGSDSELFIFAKAWRRAGISYFEPVLGLENRTLRNRQIEPDPNEKYPRFAHIYLGYLCGNEIGRWYFQDEASSQTAAETISQAVSTFAIPFAEHWCDLSRAEELIRSALDGRGPQGVVVYPWSAELVRTSPINSIQ